MSLSNAEIKQIRSLREKKFRDSLGLFVVEGEKMVEEALASSFEVLKVLRQEDIGKELMDKLSSFSSSSPVMAVVKRPAVQCEASTGGLCLALDSVRDPGNMGTIIRLAEWFGVETLFYSPDSVEIFNPKVIQSSMGSIFRVKAVCADIPSICRMFHNAGQNVYGTFLDGDNIYGTELSKEGLVVMGNESRGISRETAALVDSRILIPSYGNSKAESLNVAVATAVTLAEFKRR